MSPDTPVGQLLPSLPDALDVLEVLVASVGQLGERASQRGQGGFVVGAGIHRREPSARTSPARDDHLIAVVQVPEYLTEMGLRFPDAICGHVARHVKVMLMCHCDYILHGICSVPPVHGDNRSGASPIRQCRLASIIRREDSNARMTGGRLPAPDSPVPPRRPVTKASGPGLKSPQGSTRVRPRPTAHPTSVERSCTAWPVTGLTCSTRTTPARVAVASTAPAGMVRCQSSPRRARI